MCRKTEVGEEIFLTRFIELLLNKGVKLDTWRSGVRLDSNVCLSHLLSTAIPGRFFIAWLRSWRSWST
jgi:hypothetical protein